MITNELLAKANLKIKTVPIKGKKYAMVASRVDAFREICPSGTIETVPVVTDEKRAIFQAKIYDEKGHLLASGTAEEVKDSTQINQTSFVENCETSAVGRALAMLGIGSEDNMASAEEVATAIMNQTEIVSAKRQIRIYCNEHALDLKQVYDEHSLTKDSKESSFFAVLAELMKAQGE